MSAGAVSVPGSRARSRGRGAGRGGGLGLGVATLWLSVIVLLPLAAVAVRATEGDFWATVTSRQAVAALELSVGCALAVAAINAVMGTLVAWVLVRDAFPGRRIADALIDLPFALPTIVAGLTLLALYGHGVASRWGIVLALAFVTLPFVVRSVQPVLLALDREVEEAAASLGASPATTFRRVVLPALRPAIVSGAALSFSRAVGEFGSIVLISGNVPFHTQVSSVYVFKQIESDNPAGAAAASVVLLAVSLGVLLVLRVVERRG